MTLNNHITTKPPNHPTTKPLTLLTIALALTAGMGMGSSALGREWSNRIRATWLNTRPDTLREDGYSVGTQGIVIGTDGRMHLFYSSDLGHLLHGRNRDLYQTILDSSGAVIDSSIRYTFDSSVFFADIVGDIEGNVHCLYHVNGPDSLIYFKTDPDGEVLGDHICIFPSTIHQNYYGDRIDVDADGNVWMFYNLGQQNNRRIHLVKITPEGEVFDWEVGQSNELEITCMDVSPDGNIHLAGVGFILLGHWIGYMRISPEGEVLTDITALSPVEQDHSYWPYRLRVDENNAIHLQASISGEGAVGYWRFNENLDTLAIVSVDRRFQPVGGGIEILGNDSILLVYPSFEYEPPRHTIKYAVIKYNRVIEGPQTIATAGISNSSVTVYNERAYISTTEDTELNDRYYSADLFYHTSPLPEENGVRYQPVLPDVDIHAYPIPFNETLYLSIDLPYPAYITCTVTDIQGRRVGSLWNGFMFSGKNRLSWNPSLTSGGISAGKYLITLRKENSVTFMNTVYIK